MNPVKAAGDLARGGNAHRRGHAEGQAEEELDKDLTEQGIRGQDSGDRRQETVTSGLLADHN
jgi:hypothetical protein